MMQSLQFRAMNTDVLLAVEGQGASERALQRAREEIEAFERRFSRFRPDSELSVLNGSAGQWTPVSDEMLDLLILAQAYYQETGGLFDPSVLPDLRRAGYDATFDLLRGRDASAATGPRAAREPFTALELDTAHGLVRLPEGMQIDLGGIGKGWIVQRVAERLRSGNTGAAVSAGGDMYFAGMPAGGKKWRVEIEDPLDVDGTAAVLNVGEGAVVTSSISKRTWTQGGQARHHIIDPRSGEPAQTEWLSVTVVAPRADLAETYAKALLIGGQPMARRLLVQRPQIAVISITPDGQVLASDKCKEYLDGSNQRISSK